jgi:preprotein translocase subunit YajC
MARQWLAAVMCCFLLSTPAAGGQNSRGDWSAVSSLPAGTPVEVQRRNGGTVRGTITSVSTTTLSVTPKSGAAISIDRQAITSVYRTKGRHVVAGAAIGAVIGVAAGAGLGAAACSPSGFCTRGQGVEVGAPILGAVGALIGAAIGLHRSKELVYRA